MQVPWRTQELLQGTRIQDTQPIELNSFNDSGVISSKVPQENLQLQ